MRTDGNRVARRRLEHVLGRQEPQRRPSTIARWARRRRIGRWGWATTGSTGSSGVRPTTGIPTSPRTTTTSTNRTCPKTAITCPRTSPTRRSSSSATPSSPSRTSRGTCGSAPGANHAPHHCPQEYIDKYKGEFDDGYEAYREWVLPRMIERGILPEGTELTPINPMPEGTFCRDRRRATVGLADRRGEAAVLPHGRGLCRLLRVHRRPGRPHHRLPGGVRPARQHAHPLLRRQRCLGRGQPERLGERGQDSSTPTRTRSRTTWR